MYVYVCIHICMYIYMHVYIHIYVCIITIQRRIIHNTIQIRIIHNTSRFSPYYATLGMNFTLATQLTARLMRIRGKYPRGEKWLVGEMEDWEVEWEQKGWLEADPLHPECYL